MMKHIRHFFSLKKDPFPQNIASADLYMLPSLEPMQKRIEFAISMRSFSLVTGDVGSGKSTSLRYVIDNLAKGEHEVIMFTAGSYTMTEFLRQVLLCFGIIYNSYKIPLMLRQIQEQLLEMNGRRISPVLVIDEAHLLRAEIFSYLHLLTQHKLDSSPLMSTILCGQESLIEKLMTPDAKPLASRIMGRSHLEAIRKEVMEQYIEHHMHLAGAKKSIFSDSAITAIHQGSGGLLRRANNLAKGALLAAAMEKSQTVSSEHVRLALTEVM
ncbi:MAG: AAA family ATPase [Sphaerochaetaceae bacterium]